MECSEVRDLLSPMTDHEITGDELHNIEQHLRACRDCAFESTMIVGLKRLVGRWEGVRVSEEFRAKVVERVSREPPPGRRTGWWPIALGGVLGTAFAVVLVLAIALPVAPEAPAAGTERGPSETEAAGKPVPAPEPGGAGGLAHAPATYAAPVAQILIEEGAVHIDRPGSFPSLASAGDILAPGQSVRCSETGQARLALLAGIIMRLEGGGELTFAEGDYDCELRAGRALLRGPRGARQAIPFLVRCGTTFVRLAGSDIITAVERDTGGGARVLVAEGSVGVHLGVKDLAGIRTRGGARAVDAGETIEIGPDGTAEGAPREAEPGEIERLLQWGNP